MNNWEYVLIADVIVCYYKSYLLMKYVFFNFITFIRMYINMWCMAIFYAEKKWVDKLLVIRFSFIT